MMATSRNPNRRASSDVMRLMRSKHEAKVSRDMKRLVVKFYGPKDTAYEGGVWLIRVCVTDIYPFKAPLVGFMNRIFHPNVDESTGVICLDVTGHAWSPLYEHMEKFATEEAVRKTYGRFLSNEKQLSVPSDDSESSLSDFSEDDD
uniref:Ubiquitin-conjugating enzyme E2 H n=1 Tax=Ascaris suum TaxID=6253 RepID=F1LG80_ASCSU